MQAKSFGLDNAKKEWSSICVPFRGEMMSFCFSQKVKGACWLLLTWAYLYVQSSARGKKAKRGNVSGLFDGFY
jgi:hypothetical protein